jgi:hypothetical protein
MKNNSRINRESATDSLIYFQPYYEQGIIESVSSEQNKLFIIARRPPRDVIDKNGKETKVPGLLFGNEAGLKEDQITLTELKIIGDVDLSQSVVNPTDYIGRKVLIKMVGGHPIECILKESNDTNPSIITKEQLYEARMQSPSRDIKSKESRRYLKQKFGYTDKQIGDVVDATYGKISPNGYRLTYGTSEWDSQTEADLKGTIDMSDSGKTATNIPSSKLRTKTCFYHAKVFTGK